jgi:hypothetical protein
LLAWLLWGLLGLVGVDLEATLEAGVAERDVGMRGQHMRHGRRRGRRTGDGEDDNVRIDSRRREFPDAQASPVTRPSRQGHTPCHAFYTPKSRTLREKMGKKT